MRGRRRERGWVVEVVVYDAVDGQNPVCRTIFTLSLGAVQTELLNQNNTGGSTVRVAIRTRTVTRGTPSTPSSRSAAWHNLLLPYKS